MVALLIPPALDQKPSLSCIGRVERKFPFADNPKLRTLAIQDK